MLTVAALPFLSSKIYGPITSKDDIAHHTVTFSLCDDA
jgi:hypothetical protein